MHLVPTGDAARRVIDEEHVCDAIRGINGAGGVPDAAERFGIVGDPTRLTILLAIYHAGPIAVSDLAVAGNLQDTTVSQALRILRAKGVVTAVRDGRVMRYQLADERIAELLELVSPRGASRHSLAN